MTSSRPSAMMNISRATSPLRQMRSPGVKMYARILSTRSCRNSGSHSWNIVTFRPRVHKNLSDMHCNLPRMHETEILSNWPTLCALWNSNCTEAVSSRRSSQGCRRVGRVGRLPRLACHALDWSAGGLLRWSAASLSVVLQSTPAQHARLVADILARMLRGRCSRGISSLTAICTCKSIYGPITAVELNYGFHCHSVILFIVANVRLIRALSRMMQ